MGHPRDSEHKHTQGLRQYTDELCAISQTHNVDMCCISETWCTARVPDGPLNLKSFTPSEKDR